MIGYFLYCKEVSINSKNTLDHLGKSITRALSFQDFLLDLLVGVKRIGLFKAQSSVISDGSTVRVHSKLQCMLYRTMVAILSDPSLLCMVRSMC